MSDPEALFAAQHRLAPARRSGFDRAARLAALDRLRAAVLAHRAEIEAALQADFGKHPTETLLTEIVPVLQEISHACRHLRGWMRVRRVWPSLTMLGASGRIVPQPKGVALIIAPWNFPLNLALGPLVSALAAGCSVVLKPSEMTPATSALLARMLAETFPPDLVAVVEGGPEVATRLLALPFDHIFFTGSPAVGRIVMAAAAKTLASVTLELGGKSPVIVGPEANIAKAAKWLAWGKFFNAGQTCIAPDHVFVHASVTAALEEALRAEIGRMYGDDPVSSPALAKLVSTRHWHRLRGLIDGALAGGARLAEGGGGDEAARSMAPVILTGTTDAMQISKEEIFGPVLPL
ncbi:MAG: aldehyde dehydrogenase family protein, partial [Rhodobacteraceae bacterium]|nr:aldehyde dehydrogenase family protein [Paracoccaceae bacterium]